MDFQLKIESVSDHGISLLIVQECFSKEKESIHFIWVSATDMFQRFIDQGTQSKNFDIKLSDNLKQAIESIHFHEI